MSSEVKTFAIPDDLCRRAGISLTWRCANDFGVYAWKNVKFNHKDQPSEFSPANATVFNVRQSAIIFHPVLRKLVNEGSGTFSSIQNIIADKDIEKPELIRFSLQYRSIIRACLENLQDEIMRAKSGEREELQSYVTIFYSIECIWHLCEILFIENIPGNIILPHLLDWVRFHFPKYERKAANLLTSTLVGLESHPDYWDTVTGSILQGRIDVAKALLRLHSSSDSDIFRLADQVLKSMPVYTIYGGVSATEFNLNRQQWITDTQSKIDAKLFVCEPRLDFLMRLIVGEESAWDQVEKKCEAWYELLAAWLLYTEPTVKSFELGRYAKNCISRMGLRDHMKHLDRVLLAAMEADIFQIIEEIQHMNENGWFVAHLTDLLYHSGRLKILNGEKSDILLRQSFLSEYGSLLMGHHSLWQAGLIYLDHCSTDGTGLIDLLLPRVPAVSELKVHKIYLEATNRTLPHIVQSVCKAQGMRLLRRGKLGGALAWALKSNDSNFTSFIADKFLRQYCETGELSNIDLLENLGSSMLCSDKLIFLGKYCEFHKVYQSKEFKKAASLLVSLISSKITPFYFWTTLLSDALPLLECEQMVITSSDTYTILHFLEEKSKAPKLDEVINLLRLAIARNLARALIYEAEKS